MAVYGGLLLLTYFQFTTTPTSFIPQQDKGYLVLNVQLPDSASVERTESVMARIESIVRDTEGVAHSVGISGQSLILGANAPNVGSMYVLLNDFAERRQSGLSADAIAATIRDRCQKEVQRSDRHQLRRAADRRIGHHRRLQVHRRGPRQPRP